jgi:large subunit ribosomal protein L39e
MTGRKNELFKKMLARKCKSNRRVPLWVMIKTNRAVSQNPHQYRWRHVDLGRKVRKKIKKSEGK